MRASTMGVLRLIVGLLPLLGQCTAQLEKLALLASSSTPLGLSNGVAVGNSFDQSRLGDSPSSSFLPGFQRQPIDFQNFLSSSSISPASSSRFSPAFNAGFASSFGGGSGGGTMLTNGLDIETFTKNAAIQANQDNAIVAQLANMASTKRAQLARDVGNRTAVNELVSRIRNELVGSPTGLGSFSQSNRLGSLLMLDAQQQQQLGALQRQLSIGGGMGNGMGIGGNGLSISQQQRLAAENQLLRQMLLAAQNGQSRGIPPPFNVGSGQSGLLGGGVVSNPFGVSSNQQLGLGAGRGGALNGGSLLGAFPPPNPFPGAAADSSILTRPLAANSMLSDQLPLLAGAKHAASPITNIRPSTLDGDPSNSASDGEDALLRSLNRLQQGPREGFIDNVEDGFGHRVPVQRQGRDSVIPTSDALAVEAVEGAPPLPPPPHIARREESGKHKASRAAAKAKAGGVQSGAGSMVNYQNGAGGSAAISPQDKSKS